MSKIEDGQKNSIPTWICLCIHMILQLDLDLLLSYSPLFLRYTNIVYVQIQMYIHYIPCTYIYISSNIIKHRVFTRTFSDTGHSTLQLQLWPPSLLALVDQYPGGPPVGKTFPLEVTFKGGRIMILPKYKEGYL